MVAALANAANSAINNIFLIRVSIEARGLGDWETISGRSRIYFWGVQQNVQMTIDLISDSSDSAAADRGEYRQAAGAIAQSLKLYRRSGSVSVSSEKETKDEKQAQHFGQCQI
jgi:hypothetical protein